MRPYLSSDTNIFFISQGRQAGSPQAKPNKLHFLKKGVFLCLVFSCLISLNFVFYVFSTYIIGVIAGRCLREFAQDVEGEGVISNIMRVSFLELGKLLPSTLRKPFWHSFLGHHHSCC
jgi:hypothetical protein